MEMVTAEFRKVVREKDILMARIMLKDSLFVDTSFKQFDSMVHYAEENGLTVWISDDEDDLFESDKDEDLKVLLVQLVNCFSRKRVNFLKKLISKKYTSGSEQPTNKHYERTQNEKEYYEQKKGSIFDEFGKIVHKTISVMPVRPSEQEWNTIKVNRRKINELMNTSKKGVTTMDLLRIRDAAKEIEETCDKILRKWV